MSVTNLNLLKRKEDTRDKAVPKVSSFELNEIMKHFTEAINEIDKQGNLADELVDSGNISIAENLWRSQIVFLSSAFDFYMHELTKYGLYKIFKGEWEKTQKYCNIQVDMESIERALKNAEDRHWFLEYINNYYSSATMVSYDSVKKQLNLMDIDIRKIANDAFYERGNEEKTIDKLKRRLNELFYRRNIIVHQTDREHSNAKIKEIKKETVIEYMDDIKKIVNAIDKEAQNK